MDEHIDWNLLGRFVARETSIEEDAEVRKWMEADPAHARIMAELEEICSRAKNAPYHVDVEAAWTKVDGRTKPATGLQAVDRSPARLRQGRFVPALKVTALLAVVGVAVWLLVPQEEVPDPPAEKVYATRSGQRATIELVDGTRVMLNVASTLTLPASFSEDRREVYLEGEAFFSVTPDAARPFMVGTENAVVEVLGTEFNIRSYRESRGVQVAVVGGRVSLRKRQQNVEAATILTHDEVGLLSGDGDVRVRHNGKLDTYLSWTEGRLSFDRTPFPEVIAELERWYDLEIELADGAAGEALLTTTFTDEPVREILRVVATSMKLRYEVDGRKVTFLPLTPEAVPVSPE